MAQKYWLPTEDVKLAEWMDNFGPKLTTHGLTLNLSAPAIADAQARCLFGAASIRLRLQVGQFSQDVTRFKRAALWGDEPTPAWPAFAMPGDLPAVTTAGVVPWLTLLVGKLKRETTYTKQIGEELGIEGADQPTMAPSEAAAVKPVLKLTLASGGHPNVGWKKKGMQGIKLQVDRGDGKGFVFLAVDSEPDYLDTAALPASGVSAIWKYRATYIQHDEEVGQWCDPVSITVTGV